MASLLQRAILFRCTARPFLLNSRRAFSTTIEMTLEAEESPLGEMSPAMKLRSVKERYPGIKNIPPRLLDMSPAEVRVLEHETK